MWGEGGIVEHRVSLGSTSGGAISWGFPKSRGQPPDWTDWILSLTISGVVGESCSGFYGSARGLGALRGREPTTVVLRQTVCLCKVGMAWGDATSGHHHWPLIPPPRPPPQTH